MFPVFVAISASCLRVHCHDTFLYFPGNPKEWKGMKHLCFSSLRILLSKLLFRGVTLLRTTKAYWTTLMPLHFSVAPHTISSSPYSNHSPITQIFYIICITRYSSQEEVWEIDAVRIGVVNMRACQICVNVHVCTCLFSLSSSAKNTKIS